MLELKVDGMTCGGCAATVKKVVERTAPGVTATVDLPTKTVRVDGAADRPVLEAAIRKAGYEVL
jgi:copper chaperone